MSYTPDNQLMQDKLLDAAEALGKLADPIKERLRTRQDWNQEHLDFLKVLLLDITQMQVRL